MMLRAQQPARPRRRAAAGTAASRTPNPSGARQPLSHWNQPTLPAMNRLNMLKTPSSAGWPEPGGSVTVHGRRPHRGSSHSSVACSPSMAGPCGAPIGAPVLCPACQSARLPPPPIDSVGVGYSTIDRGDHAFPFVNRRACALSPARHRPTARRALRHRRGQPRPARPGGPMPSLPRRRRPSVRPDPPGRVVVRDLPRLPPGYLGTACAVPLSPCGSWSSPCSPV